MNKNKQYPYSFKHNIAFQIWSDEEADDALKKYVYKNHTDLEYKKFKLSKQITNLMGLIKWSVIKICDTKFTKSIIWEECSAAIQDKCKRMSRWYYSAAKRAIEKSKINQDELHERSLLVWYNMMTKHLNLVEGQTDDTKKTTKKILQLSKEDKTLLIDSCIGGDLKSLPFVLDILYPDNEDERYNIVEKAISHLDDNNNLLSDVTYSIELIFDQLVLTDWNRNMGILKQLIKNTKWCIKYSELPKFLLQNDQDKLEISKLVLSYGLHHAFIPFFDLLDIQSEEIRFEIAKLVALKDWYIWEHLEKFNITDSYKLEELADINSGSIKNEHWKTQPINNNFVNHALKFQLDNDKLFDFINRSLSPYTVFNIWESWFTNKKMLLLIIENILAISAKYGTLESNLWYIFSYINKLSEEENTLYCLEIWKYLTAQQDVKIIIKKLKGFLESWLISNDQYSNIFEAFYSRDLQIKLTNKFGVKDYIHLLTFVSCWDEGVSPFSTRQDIVIFIAALEKWGYIDSHIKAAIFSENHHFEQLKNFVSLIFQWNVDKVNIWRDLQTSLDAKQLSRQLFFEKIWIKFPINQEKYHKDRIQEFYLATYRLYKIVWCDFFENLQLNESVFQKNHLIMITELFNSILNIISIKNTNKYHHINQNITQAISKFHFSQLVETIPESMKKDFTKCDNIGNVVIDSDNINEIVADFSNILVYLFQEHFHIKESPITTDDFNKMNEKWWNMDVIYTLFSHFSSLNNKSIQKVLSRITEMIILDRFHEYKYEGYYRDCYDKDITDEQIWFLDGEQIATWKQNKIELHYYSWNNKSNQHIDIFDEMFKVIQNGFIDNKHLDEIESWFTQKIINYNPEWNEVECIEAIKNKHKVDDILSHFSQLSSEDLFNLWFVSLLQSKNDQEVIASINFIKRISIKYKFNISKLKTEFDIILSKKKLLRKNNSESIFFTCETDNPKILLEIGDMVQGAYSCQNYKWWSWYLSALPWYVIDSWVKAILSFEITKQYFKDNHTWNQFKEIVKQWDYTLKFNGYKLCLEINGYTIQLTKAWYRNIMKLWRDHGQPVLFLEQPYTNLSNDKQSFVSNIHTQLKENKLTRMKGSRDIKHAIFPQSRNPGWIYVDANNTIERSSYHIRL